MADELGAWNNGAGIPLETWAASEGNYKLAVGYAALLWPRFEAVGKYVLVEGASTESIEGFENQAGSTPKGVEWVLNHCHLADLHSHDDDDVSADKLLFIGNIVKEMWEAKLQTQFPDRPCTVEFYVPDDPEELWEYQVSFLADRLGRRRRRVALGSRQSFRLDSVSASWSATFTAKG